MFARFSALLLAVFIAQDGGNLRIRVVLDDPSGVPTPIPRVVLLVSDNPATAEPRRVRTSNDGTVELRLKPASYTVESDQPIAFAGRTYAWTQMIDVGAGRVAVLDLNAKNADVGTITDAAASASAAPIDADSATVLARWQDSVVELWTPIVHASGFVIDAPRGLIATSQRSIGAANDVEVEMIAAGTRRKIPGRVVHEDRLTGAAIVRVDPHAISTLPSLAPTCSSQNDEAPRYRDEVTAIVAPMLGSKELADGEVTRVTSQAIFIDMRIVRDAAGGPVFTDSGELLGISAINDVDARTSEVFVVPVPSLCATMAAADNKISGEPPKTVSLPVEPPRATPRGVVAAPTAKKTTPPAISASNFDIRLLTPDQLREYGNSNPMADVANWNDYIRDVPPVLLIRVSPQFEESFWKMLARGAAATQGMSLPPLKSFTSNFLKMRAYCGDAEVTPIHPFIIERPVQDHASIREGLYVFERDAFGTQCKSVRLDLFSEKSPNTPESKLIDPKLFASVMMN